MAAFGLVATRGHWAKHRSVCGSCGQPIGIRERVAELPDGEGVWIHAFCAASQAPAGGPQHATA